MVTMKMNGGAGYAITPCLNVFVSNSETLTRNLNYKIAFAARNIIFPRHFAKLSKSLKQFRKKSEKANSSVKA
jgi:hypothetical protein